MKAVIVHIDKNGDISYRVSADVRLFIVDERSPDDRVYEYLSRVSGEEIAKILRDDPIGSKNDGRHRGVEARVLALIEGKPRLQLVEDEPGSAA